MNLVYGVTTYNRVNVLKQNLEGWDKTRDKSHQWTLIICDDGSTDGTKDFIQFFSPQGVNVVRKFNKRIGIGPQINCIFEYTASIPFDYGFRSDDDIEFLKSGWDNLYIDSIKTSHFDFLCFFDGPWAMKNRNPNIVRKPFVLNAGSKIQCGVTHPHDGMGAFFTFTPKLIRTVGYMDEIGIGIWGNEHTDYANRCARAESADKQFLWDALNSQEYIRLFENCVSSISEQEKTKAQEHSPNSRTKWSLITQKRRIFVPNRKARFNMIGEVR